MLSFECDVEDILAAQKLLNEDEDSDPADYLSRVLVFCQCAQRREDFQSSVSALRQTVADIGGAGVLIRYESAILIVLEASAAQTNDVLRRLCDLGESWTSHVCSAEEGVQCAFHDFRLIEDVGEEGCEYRLNECDENEVVSALARITHEFLASASPKTASMDKCLSRIAADAGDFLFTCEEFLDEFDIDTHICRAVDFEAPEIENIIVEYDESLACCV